MLDEKAEIVALVEQSHLAARRTLNKLGIPRRVLALDVPSSTIKRHVSLDRDSQAVAAMREIIEQGVMLSGAIVPERD